VTPFTTLNAIAAPLPEANVDTDIILPARFLLITEKKGLGRYAFYERRYAPDETLRADFPLNDPRYAGAQILIAGENFGCGSSREHAPWALADLGFRCIIAPSFGEIFAANCVKNGMLPVALPAADVDRLMAAARAGRSISVDLIARQIIDGDQIAIGFDFPDSQRDALLNGWDDIAMIKAKQGAAIDAFETMQRGTQPWLWKEQTHG
jgi:3-isopropylmalate dehydratase small subunit